MIELKCVIDQVPFPSRTVTWRRGTTILVFNTSRGGISVRGDATWGYVRSRLYIADTTPADSGVYSCWYSNYTSDTVTVHVLAGENSAAMQHDAAPPPSSGSPSTTKNLITTFITCTAATWTTIYSYIWLSTYSASWCST
ncbi:hypothetical protein OTU49_000442 [Cherax quadricarinatus]|uniref:Ig-like domain-containing protein n=4 Tax=Cherax quadricarinatus TaxID=27406 RepID=A0AAW0XYU4_CHEQU